MGAGPIDGRADLFALGVGLYEMLAGSSPFEARTPVDAIIATARDPHVPLRKRRPDVPAGLAAIVDRCLAKSPADRYPDANALAEALRVVPTVAPAISVAPRGRLALIA